MCKNKGFTLIELMIVLCIIAILVAIVVPAFQEHAKRNRPETARDRSMRSLSAPIEVPPGMDIFTDPKTGCQYINSGTAMTPRMDASGQQICHQDQ